MLLHDIFCEPSVKERLGGNGDAYQRSCYNDGKGDDVSAKGEKRWEATQRIMERVVETKEKAYNAKKFERGEDESEKLMCFFRMVVVSMQKEIRRLQQAHQSCGSFE